MLTFDIAMPLMLFAVTMAALLLSKRVEGRLKSTLEEREFKPRDTVLFVVLIAVAVSVVVFIPELALIALFLFSYSSLLFTFSYLFSGLSKKRIVLLESVFAVVSLVVGIVALFGPFVGASVFYAGIAAFGLVVFCFAVVLVEAEVRFAQVGNSDFCRISQMYRCAMGKMEARRYLYRSDCLRRVHRPHGYHQGG